MTHRFDGFLHFADVVVEIADLFERRQKQKRGEMLSSELRRPVTHAARAHTPEREPGQNQLKQQGAKRV
jgi:hypothetical protein